MAKFTEQLKHTCHEHEEERIQKRVSITIARCLKITEKVSFNIASKASYVYIILSGRKFIKNAKNGPIWGVFENLSLRSNIATRQVSFNMTKISGKCQNSKIQMRHFG